MERREGGEERQSERRLARKSSRRECGVFLDDARFFFLGGGGGEDGRRGRGKQVLNGSPTPSSVLEKGWMDGGKVGCQRAKTLTGISCLGAGVGGLQPGLTLQPFSSSFSSSPPHIDPGHC